MAVLKFLACFIIARQAQSGDGSLLWNVVAGPCEMIGDCIQSPNYPQKYGNQEQCNITLVSSTPLAINVTAFDTENRWDALTVNGKRYSRDQGPDGVVPTGTITWTSDVNNAKSGWMLCPRPLDADDVSTTVATAADASVSRRPGHRPRFRPIGRRGNASRPRSASCPQPDSEMPLENQPMVAELQSQLRELKGELAEAQDHTDTFIGVVDVCLGILQPIIDLDDLRTWLIEKIEFLEKLAYLCTMSVFFQPYCTPIQTYLQTKRTVFEQSTQALSYKAEYARNISSALEEIKGNLTFFKDTCVVSKHSLGFIIPQLDNVKGESSELAASLTIPFVVVEVTKWQVANGLAEAPIRVGEEIMAKFDVLKQAVDPIVDSFSAIQDGLAPISQKMDEVMAFMDHKFCYKDIIPSNYDVCIGGGTFGMLGWDVNLSQECLLDYLPDKCLSLNDILNAEVCVTLPDYCTELGCVPATNEPCSVLVPSCGWCEYDWCYTLACPGYPCNCQDYWYCAISGSSCSSSSDCPGSTTEQCYSGCLSDLFPLKQCIGAETITEIMNTGVQKFMNGTGLTDILKDVFLQIMPSDLFADIPDISGLYSGNWSVQDIDIPNLMTNAAGLLEVQSCEPTGAAALPPSLDADCELFVEEAELRLESPTSSRCEAGDFSAAALEGLCRCSLRNDLIAAFDTQVKCGMRPGCSLPDEAGRTFGDQLSGCPVCFPDLAPAIAEAATAATATTATTITEATTATMTTITGTTVTATATMATTTTVTTTTATTITEATTRTTATTTTATTITETTTTTQTTTTATTITETTTATTATTITETTTTTTTTATTTTATTTTATTTRTTSTVTTTTAKTTPAVHLDVYLGSPEPRPDDKEEARTAATTATTTTATTTATTITEARTMITAKAGSSQTTTIAPSHIVSSSLLFESSGTAAGVQAAVTSYFVRELVVSPEQLTVVVHRPSARRLGSSRTALWQIDFTIADVDSSAALKHYDAVQGMREDPATAASAMQKDFEVQGLQLDEASVALVVEPSLQVISTTPTAAAASQAPSGSDDAVDEPRGRWVLAGGGVSAAFLFVGCMLSACMKSKRLKRKAVCPDGLAPPKPVIAFANP